jgi:hypothetical protein
MIKQEPTSINVDPELWKASKIEAIRRGIIATELFEVSLWKELTRLAVVDKRERGE